MLPGDHCDKKNRVFPKNPVFNFFLTSLSHPNDALENIGGNEN